MQSSPGATIWLYWVELRMRAGSSSRTIEDWSWPWWPATEKLNKVGQGTQKQHGTPPFFFCRPRPALRSRSFLRSSPQAISTLHIPSTFVNTFVRHSRLAPSCEAPPRLFARLHPIPIRPALPSRSFLRSSPQAISTLHIPSTFVNTFVRHSRLAPSCEAPPKLFVRLHPISIRPALPSRSFLRSSRQAICTFTSHSHSSGTPVSLLPALLPLSYFHASHPIHARPALRSLLPAELPPSYLHASHPIHIRPAFPSRSFLRSSFLSSFLPFFLPFRPSFLPPLLVRLFCLAPLPWK